MWRGVGERPDTRQLLPNVAAEVLLCTGILTGWIGSRNKIKDAQEIAKNLITESISYYESQNEIKKVAQARTEIAYCYWREGEVNEARIRGISGRGHYSSWQLSNSQPADTTMRYKF
jgi:hypothetical protein